ncbi:MAG: homocysteine S-methyltransferase family protein [Cyclobacteriaceae bacterium]|nr:homocysteine S-methyltransferase family protein [Cyclobacteriaceae bacterium]MCK5701709.1 homocysteine S-methyltransferase family protein [Cyclobacteriaceae bacterium]
MNKYRNNLPQLNGKTFLTDGGLETTLIFHQGLDLPHFASFDVLTRPNGKEIIKDYLLDYIEIARKRKMGFILESPTWRASKDWGYKLGFTRDSLDEVNTVAIAQLEDIRNEHEDHDSPMVISGCIGPRGDGYSASVIMSVVEAQNYHGEQIKTLSLTAADLVSAHTINYSNEAMGMALAAKENEIPIAIGFTVETDSKLPSGETLQEVIEKVDGITDNYPSYYMINCAHPSHFKEVLQKDGLWKNRIMAIRANASIKSHAELDECEHLDAGDSWELAHDYRELKNLLPNLNVIGGCCGTDHTHIEEICEHWFENHEH